MAADFRDTYDFMRFFSIGWIAAVKKPEHMGQKSNRLPWHRHMGAAHAIMETGKDPAHCATMHRVKRVSVCTFRVDTLAFTNCFLNLS
jgi:hypothetical protein